MSFREEFPDFPADAIPADVLGNGWTDVSYRNDVCPRFERGDFELFIDFPDATMREYDAPQYRAYHPNGEIESDCWANIVEFVKFGGVL